MKIQVGVVYGGKSVEHEVSVISALQAMKSFDHNKYEIIPIYYGKDQQFYTGRKATEASTYQKLGDIPKLLEVVDWVREGQEVFLKYRRLFRVKQRVDVVFPIMHGATGEDGKFQGFLETLGVPYCESGVLSCSIVQDKAMMRRVLKSADVPLVNGFEITRSECILHPETLIEKAKEIGGPWIIKPVSGGSSIGILCCDNEEQLIPTALECFAFDSKLVVEHRFTDFREFNIGLLGDHDEVKLSLIEEVFKSDTILSYIDKYGGSSSKGMESVSRALPAGIEDEICEQIKNAAKAAFKVCECSGVVRIDFLYDNETKCLYLNEINTIPGSLAAYLFKDMSRQELLDRCINLAFRKERSNKKIVSTIDSSLLKTGVIDGIKK